MSSVLLVSVPSLLTDGASDWADDVRGSRDFHCGYTVPAPAPKLSAAESSAVGTCSEDGLLERTDEGPMTSNAAPARRYAGVHFCSQGGGHEKRAGVIKISSFHD